MNYQWYPGHMMKAKRMMQENIKLIDLIIELVDARIPLSSRNPEIDQLGVNKSRIILLNKADLADPRENKKWAEYFTNLDFFVLEINAKSGNGIKKILPLVQQACQEKIERDKKRGIKNRPIRAMVVGIPNVGKSTFINSFAGKACTKTGNKPGVTKGKQWIRLNKDLELLDTPGILWPKFEDQDVGMKLAFIGSMNDEIILKEEMTIDLIRYLKLAYPSVLLQRYEVDENQEADIIFSQIAENRKCYTRGSELDYIKIAGIIMDDFRSGRLGRITLEGVGEDGRESRSSEEEMA